MKVITTITLTDGTSEEKLKKAGLSADAVGRVYYDVFAHLLREVADADVQADIQVAVMDNTKPFAHGGPPNKGSNVQPAKAEPRTGTDTGECRVFKCSLCGYGVEDIFQENERDYPVGDFNFCPHCGAEIVKE